MRPPRGALLTYNAIQLALLPAAAPPLALYALARRKYRGIVAQRLGLGRVAARKGSPRFWIHALSVGEVNASSPLLDALSDAWPHAVFYLSASTASGLATLQNRKLPEKAEVFALPYDLFFSVQRRIAEIRPDLFIVVETDIWPNLIWGLRAAGVPTVLANGSISSTAARRLRKLPGLARFLYGGFDRIVMQSQEDATRLKSLLGGLAEGLLAAPGNLKYDKLAGSTAGRGGEASFGLPADVPVLVAGSTHPGEEEQVFRAFMTLRADAGPVQLVLAPRDPGRGPEVAALAEKMGLCPVLRSRWREREMVKGLLVLDTLGELIHCYGLATAAFVGGSLCPVGGHDLLEPASAGVPVLFGPHVESCFEAARELEEAGGGMEVGTWQELAAAWKRLLTDGEAAREMGRRAMAFVDSRRGVAMKYVDIAGELLGELD